MLPENTIISVHECGKFYKIFNSPADRLVNAVLGYKNYREHWALKPLSVDIKRGESWGVIGKNGSGKSTLLQLLTGTLAPSTGTIYVEGTVAALLELGAGFNPEYTGIENIYLYSSLLGISRRIVEGSIDNILSFADIGDYVHQPVKTYSSGMFLRLAFACAVNVDPDILIVDEALAVGDARFQLKCHKRIRTMLDSGTSLLFVSHSTEAVKDLCSKSIVLDEGRLSYKGDTLDAVVKYYQILFPEQSNPTRSSPENMDVARKDNLHPQQLEDSAHMSIYYPEDSISKAFGIGGATIESISFSGNSVPGCLHPGERIEVHVLASWDSSFVHHYLVANSLDANITTGIAFTDVKGIAIFGLNGFDSNTRIDPGIGRILTKTSFVVPHIRPADYFITVAIALGQMHNHVQLQCYEAFCKISVERGTLAVNGLLGLRYDFESSAPPAL